MKKFTKIISCLTAAALICSAGAFSACGSGDDTDDNNSTYNGETESEGNTTTGGNTDDGTTDDSTKDLISDEVTEDLWNAAVDYSSFYNCTIEFNGTGLYDTGTNYTDEAYSSNDSETTINTSVQQTSYYDLYSDESENVLGNVYTNATEYRKAVYDSAYGTEAEEYNKVYENYLMNESETVSSANKVNTNGEEGSWSTSSGRNFGIGFYFLGYDGSKSNEYFSSVHSVLYGNPLLEGGSGYYNFEYVDGVYTYSIESTAQDYLFEDSFPDDYDFTGGVATYSVIIKDCKVVSVKYTKSYTLNEYYTLGTMYTIYEMTYEWTFSDYGITTVTVPNEVTALFE